MGKNGNGSANSVARNGSTKYETEGSCKSGIDGNPKRLEGDKNNVKNNRFTKYTEENVNTVGNSTSGSRFEILNKEMEVTMGNGSKGQDNENMLCLSQKEVQNSEVTCEEIWERLDRALGSMDWKLCYPVRLVKHLPRVVSNHCPILIHFFCNHTPKCDLKPLRFEAIWMKHKGFDEVVQNYWNTCREKQSARNYLQLPLSFPNLEDYEIESLNYSISKHEVKQSLFHIGRLKALGPDSFPVLFFQKYWNICKDELIELVIDWFMNGGIPDHNSQTYISLIPKIPNASSMSQLRPISLCNTSYKVISKRISENSWKPVKMTRARHAISHLFFADDLILFGQATLQQAQVMKDCFDTFCDLSGQQVSLPMSRILCSNNVSNGFSKALVDVGGSSITMNMGKYIGVPLIHGRITKDMYKEILEKT
ncbi:hypothetical protein Ddye_000840 [Dipteronia dyeriana]|uniref:Reverse transcriptase n=1 Tax=Dipteronia dyeriana TaxID=168575 RepID=A0AAD9XMD8_9ROSI|nr:hypothetical protein Ddye_000840 [Dipteronia dyeriana]